MLDTPIDQERVLNTRILVVDDVELNLKALVHSLNAHGYYNIITAKDGAQALTITTSEKLDLVILDIMMPTMDGFAYLQAVREDTQFHALPIIVQTALDETEKKLKAFSLGASDYICKPVEPRELGSRTQVHLHRKLMMEDLRSYKKRMLQEMEMAQLMQRRLMPSDINAQICERVFDMDIGSHFESSSELGGDFWGMTPLSNTRLAIYMVDFSGHGITAALNVFRLHTIMHECASSGGDPSIFLTTLNRHVQPLLERDEFATMFYGIIDTEANCLHYSSAAAPPALIYNAQDKTTKMLNGRGFPLGVIPNATYETIYEPLMKGDALLLYSDCLVETKNAEGAFLTERNIEQTMLENLAEKNEKPAKQLVHAIMQQLKNHNNQPLMDDMTLSAYWRLG